VCLCVRGCLCVFGCLCECVIYVCGCVILALHRTDPELIADQMSGSDGGSRGIIIYVSSSLEPCVCVCVCICETYLCLCVFHERSANIFPLISKKNSSETNDIIGIQPMSSRSHR